MLKAKEQPISQPEKVSGIKKMVHFNLSSCRGDDVMQNVSSARETQLFLS